MRPVAPSPFSFPEVIIQKGRPLVCLSRRIGARAHAISLGCWWRWGRFHHLVLQCEALVVEALRQQHDIGDSIVDGQYDHSGEDILEDGAEDIKDVADEPDDYELQGQAVGGAATEVLDDLRGEYDDPGGDGYGTGKWGERGLVVIH